MEQPAQWKTETEKEEAGQVIHHAVVMMDESI